MYFIYLLIIYFLFHSIHRKVGRFYTIWLTSLAEMIGSSWKFYHKCNFGQRSPHQHL